MIDTPSCTLIQPALTTSSSSEEETIEIAKGLSRLLRAGDIVALQGALGAGKTTFIKGLIGALCHTDRNAITSPTFTYMNIYEAEVPVHHFDLYRITSDDQFLMLGLNDYINDESISLIEWPEKASAHTSCANVRIEVSYQGTHERLIVIQRNTA